MDFQLSADQKALQAAIKSFCDTHLPRERLRGLEDAGGFEPALWRALADMGVFGARLPTASGGLGLGVADAVAIFEVLGQRLVPGPVIWTHLAAALVDGAASGATVVGGLDLMGAAPEPYLIEHLEALDLLILLRPDGVYRLQPRELATEPVTVSLDPFTPLHHARELPAGARLAGPAVANQLRLEGAALSAALLLGVAEAAQELALEYAKQREQFGRTIGSFQAIKHMLADMFVRVAVARAAVYAAGATLDDPAVGEVARAVSAAKVTAGDGAMKNARACIQIHGGMGFTWDVPAHYYLKRTWVLESLFGTSEEHAERIAGLVASALPAA